MNRVYRALEHETPINVEIIPSIKPLLPREDGSTHNRCPDLGTLVHVLLKYSRGYG